MSWLRIYHETTYRYGGAVRFSEHRLVLRPREGHDLRVEEMSLEIEPDFHLEWSRDIFGNSIATVHFLEKSDVLRICSRVLLRQTAKFPAPIPRPSHPPHYPPTFEPEEEFVLNAYLQSIYPADVRAVRRWVEAAIDPATCENAECVIELVNEAVHRSVRYNRREERGVQTPARTLEIGSGSCRDLATLLMEALRILGFPARFASGYLDCRASEAGRASTHAWAEAYLPGTGWVGLDPTLDEVTTHRHVVTGVSNHPRGVMPVVGSYFGTRGDFLSLDVAVGIERYDRNPADEEFVP